MKGYLTNLLEKYRVVIKMTSKDTIMKTELESLHKRENQMYEFYSEVLKNLRDDEIKKKIKFIRYQELAHIRMVTKIISILGEHMRK